eukprot:RCo040834
MPTEVLPTFNSNAIALQLHRIPSLSPYVVLLDDDMFFGRPVSRSYFFTPAGGLRLFQSTTRKITQPTEPLERQNNEWATLYTTRLALDEKLGTTDKTMYYPQHGPVMVDVGLLREIAWEFAPAVARTASHRFRHLSDLHIHFLHDNYLRFRPPRSFHLATFFRQELDLDGDGQLHGEFELHQLLLFTGVSLNPQCGLTVNDLSLYRLSAGDSLHERLRGFWMRREELRRKHADGEQALQFLQLFDDSSGGFPKARASLRKVFSTRPEVFCINDDVEEAEGSAVLRMLRRFLEAFFPRPSIWEEREEGTEGEQEGERQAVSSPG